MTDAGPAVPLVITATPNNSWLHPDANYPRTPEEVGAESARCEQAGASVLHLHSMAEWKDLVEAIRSSTSLLVQCGMSSFVIGERQEIFDLRADMISIIANHHDEAFPQGDCNVLHPKEELLAYCEQCIGSGVRPEWEIRHAGSVWNLNYLRERAELVRPVICTLFFGWPGWDVEPAHCRGIFGPPAAHARRLRGHCERNGTRALRLDRGPRSPTATTCASAPRTTLLPATVPQLKRASSSPRSQRWLGRWAARWRRQPKRANSWATPWPPRAGDERDKRPPPGGLRQWRRGGHGRSAGDRGGDRRALRQRGLCSVRPRCRSG